MSHPQSSSHQDPWPSGQLPACLSHHCAQSGCKSTHCCSVSVRCRHERHESFVGNSLGTPHFLILTRCWGAQLGPQWIIRWHFPSFLCEVAQQAVWFCSCKCICAWSTIPEQAHSTSAACVIHDNALHFGLPGMVYSPLHMRSVVCR